MIVGLATWSLATGANSTAQESASATRVIDFNILAQPLPSALLSFARRTETELFLLPEQPFTQWWSSAVAGSMTPEAALDRLLRCTPFEGDVSDDRVVVLRRRDGASLALGAEAPPPRPVQCAPLADERPLLADDQRARATALVRLLHEPAALADAGGAERGGRKS